MRVLTIIVNYRTPDLTFKAVEAVFPELERLGDDSRVVVVDNGSGDGSPEILTRRIEERGLTSRASVLATGHNGGFGYGNNFAIRQALASEKPPRFFYLLNSDAFPDEGALARLVEHMERSPETGIAGSYIHGVDGEPHQTAFRFPSIAGELEGWTRVGIVSRLLRESIVALPIPTETTDVDWLAGASMLIRREVLEEIGLFDEKFFLYYEETDLCRRARKAGWKTTYVRESTVAHVGSATTGLKRRDQPLPKYWFDSHRHYFEKNHGRAYQLAAVAAAVAGASAWKLRRFLEQSDGPGDPPRLIVDFLRYGLTGR